MDVKQHRAPGVGRVGHVRAALHQMPGQKAVHGAKAQLSPLGALVQVQRVQQPREFGTAEIRVRHQPGLLPDQVAFAFGHQFFHIGRRAAALPYDGVVHARAGSAVPQEGSFPLVGDADGRDVVHVHTGKLHGGLQSGYLAV